MLKIREKQECFKSTFYRLHFLAFVLSLFGCHPFPHLSHILNALKSLSHLPENIRIDRPFFFFFINH